MTLQDNGGDTTTVSANGSFTFPTALASGGTYAVTVSNTSPNYYTCSVTNGSGSVAGANVTNVAVACSMVPQTAMSCGNATSIGSGNVAPLVVDGFPCTAGGTAGDANTGNVPYIAVKICAPGSTTNCQIIDHVLVDTGSTGLRIASSALQSTLQPGNGLPAIAGRGTSTSLTECETYVDSYVYGPLVTADVYIAGKLVQSANMQVFGPSNYPVPNSCSSQGGISTNTTQAFGANGLIGVSFELQDDALYYDCQNANLGGCTADNFYAGLPSTVSQFSSDNNGVTISMPPVIAAGLSTPVVGTLTFGVNTQADNTPTASTIPIANNDIGEFAAQVGGTWYTAYLDSGTDILYFNDPTDAALEPLCPSSNAVNAGLYCPATTQSVPFTFANAGTTASVGSLTYQVANAIDVNTLTAMAFNNLAGPITTSSTLSDTTIAFGFSLFYGHNVYVLFDTKTAPGTGLGGTANSTVTGPIDTIQ